MIRGAISGDAGEGVAFARRDAEARLRRLREVAPEALAAARQALAPFFARAFDDPDVVLRLYTANLLDPAARRALEDHAGFLADALGPGEGTAFAQRFRALQEEIRPRLPEEERQVLEDLEQLSEVEEYRAKVETLEEIVVSGLQNGEIPEDQVVRRATLEAEINRYEDEFQLPSSNPLAAADGQQATEEEAG